MDGDGLTDVTWQESGSDTSRDPSPLSESNASTHEICGVESEGLHTAFESLSRHAILHGCLCPAVLRYPAVIAAHSMVAQPIAVGIDLGTSNSCVHVLE